MNGENELVRRFRAARMANVPLITIATPDPAATMRLIQGNVSHQPKNGEAKEPTPVMQWDVVDGVQHLNEDGLAAVAVAWGADGQKKTKGNLMACLAGGAAKLPKRSILFILNAQRFVTGEQIPHVQAVWNLRDRYKADKRTLVLLGPAVPLPDELKNDVVELDEPLPDEAELKRLVRREWDGKELKFPHGEDIIDNVAGALQGCSMFGAEQLLWMATDKDKGVSMPDLHMSVQKQIEQTPGVSIYRDECTFADIGGLDALKEYVSLIMKGRNAPRLVVWLDEIGTSGLASREDLSGVNSSMEGHLLQWMQDHRVYGVMLAGIQGAGKSEFCKSVGGEFDRRVIRLDLEATKGSLVGQSQQNLRAATKVIESCSGKGGSVLWIATANSIDGLSGPMKNRFVDVFFLDLPNRAERKPIWEVWMRKLGLKDKPYRNDDGWNGRNIWQCCDKAWRMGQSIAEVAQWITPVGVTDAEAIDRLRRGASGRYLSASHPGVYRMDLDADRKTTGRGADQEV